jgi:PhnB protein
MPATKTEIFPYIFYRDVPAALEWLKRVFGFKEEMRTTPADGGMHAEMSLGDQRIMMGQSSKGWGMISPRDSAVATMGVFVYLNDVDQHHARARAAGAEIVHAPRDESYGRTYTARDLDGHPWFFTTPPR